jgi:hypothetical protein
MRFNSSSEFPSATAGRVIPANIERTATMKTLTIITLTTLLLCPLLHAQAAPTVQFVIDPARNVHAISRFIYGVNSKIDGPWADCTLGRIGGNRLTAYNWVNSASNAGNDWHFQNDNNMGGGETPGGAMIPDITAAGQHNAGIILTIPMVSYVSADKKGDGDVRQSGSNYLQTRFHKNSPAKGSAFSLTPSAAAPVVYQDEFVNWVKTKYPYGFTDPNRPIFFMLDNEADLWSETHAEVHPEKLTYAEIMQRSVDFSTAIKKVAPTAQIFGPASYGWNGYVTLQGAPDAKGRDFLSFYLQQMKQAENTAGHRLLDVLDVHWYPEARGGNKRITEADSSPDVVAARLQAPRSLWDAKYVEDSWISKSLNGPIHLIPRLFEKIQKDYPQTKLSFSEYNYGAPNHISGAIAEADALGIFGREGVFAANQWPLSKDQPFVAAAFAMYLNMDGKREGFGDTSIHSETDNVADTSVYASTDSHNPNVMVLVAINKTDHPITAELKIAGKTFKSGHAFQLNGSDPHPKAVAITQFNNYTMPPMSVSTIRLMEK